MIRRSKTTVFYKTLAIRTRYLYNITTAGNPYENSFAPPAPAAIPT